MYVDRYPPTPRIEVIRHTYDQFEVVVFDLFGRIVRHRSYTHGAKRRVWALEQARQWSEYFYIQFDPDRDTYR